MGKNKKGTKKTPKRGVKETRAGPKRISKAKGSYKANKLISKKKIRLGFNELSPNQVSTPNSTTNFTDVAPPDVVPSLYTSTPSAPSSFGSLENSPVTPRAYRTNSSFMHKFRNNHMVPNMGFKRRKMATKNDSVKVNFAKSEINNKKVGGVDVTAGVKCEDIKPTDVLDFSCSYLNKKDIENQKDVLSDNQKDELGDNQRDEVGDNQKDEESSVQRDEDSAILVDDSMVDFDDNVDSSQINVIRDPGEGITASQDNSKDEGASDSKIHKNSHPVEDLGEEMLNFVTDKVFNNPVPDTPKTLVKRVDLFKDIKESSNEKKSDETEDDIIVIDDDLEVIDDDDDLTIVGEVSGKKEVKSTIKPLTTSNLQSITERYQPTSQDFIGFQIDKTPGKSTVVQVKQNVPSETLGPQQMKKKWMEMRKKVKKSKNVNTCALPKPRHPTNNLLVGPNLLTGIQRKGQALLTGTQRQEQSNTNNKKIHKVGGRGGQDKREGDWTCSCGNHNFRWRASCGKCNNLREAKRGEVARGESPPLVQNQGPTSVVPQADQNAKSGLRPIVIDGSNVAMAHGLNTNFSAKGIQICIQFFKKRGHTEIKAFLPQIRQGADPELLEKLYKEGHIVFTPSRKLHDGTNVISYDDSMFLEYAHELGGVIVSRDNFRDFMKCKPEWRETIEKRLLMPTFAGDYLMFPPDPLGRGGPSLDQFLKF